MKPLTGGAVLLFALSITACGGASASPPVTSTASETPTPTPTATVSQFASIIAEREQAWRDYEDDVTDCALASMGTSALDQAKHTACTFTVGTVTITAQSAVKEIMRLPSPPAEIRDLVDRTIAVLEPLGDNPATATACEDKKSEACDAAVTKANADIRQVTSVLDAWKPYL